MLLDSTSTTFQPFFLNFYKVHTLATQFFLRMWSESGAAFGDFTRVVALARSQYVLFPLFYFYSLTVNLGLRLHSEVKMFGLGMK